jgi:outer membrane protein OmpA-like peptidoglycan-associated protein
MNRMKFTSKYIIAFLFLFVSYAANAQRYSLYYTRTLYDGIQNPHHKSLDSCRSWATNFFMPSFNLDLSVSGDANTFIKSFLASENLSVLNFPNGSKYTNRITNQFNYNLFLMKIRMGKKRDAELSFYSQIKAQTAISLNNGIFNFITKGNNTFKGKTIDGFLDLGLSTNVYNETGIGFRRQITKKLSGGVKFGYLTGIANLGVDVNGSKFTTSAAGDTLDIYIKGTIRASIDPSNKDNLNTDSLIANVKTNKGYVFSGGLQYEVDPTFTIGAALLDIGKINWNDKSKYYKLDKSIQFTGIDIMADSLVQDSILNNLTSFAIDSSISAYSSKLMGRFEVSGNLKLANWFYTTIVYSKPLAYDFFDLTLITDIRIARRLNLIASGTFNSDGNNSVGAQLLFRSKLFEFYVGSERVLNSYQLFNQLTKDHTAKPALGLGADINFGIAFGFGRCPKPPAPPEPMDSDGDGILDALDNCPYVWGQLENRGCPFSDMDGDGIFDKDDACPSEKGTAAFNGCPAPDADKDNVPDAEDLCPNEAGSALTKGCPDADADGIYDKNDSCKYLAGPIENFGCPYLDFDGDGTLDKDDKCPNVAGPKTNSGCPLAPQGVELTKEERIIMANFLNNLNFTADKAVLDTASFTAMEAVVNMLLSKPTYKISISVYTDNGRKAALSKKLVESRSEVLRKYFTDKGIAPERIKLTPVGAENFIAGNKLPEDRAKNNRVEAYIYEGIE